MFTELLLYALWPGKQIRLLIILLLIPSISFVSFSMALNDPSLLQLLLCYVTIFRVINLLRIAEARMHESYLRKSVTTAGLYFVLVQSALLLLIVRRLHIDLDMFLHLLLIAQFVIATIFLISVVRTLIKSRPKEALRYHTDKELPTVSVVVPARNETRDLEYCLDSILMSDYPKLEVIVLDDCSHDKTSDIIKRYAHAGVRFVQGKEPNERWLAKNWAYQKLYEESTGQYLLFCGVDIRLGKDSIRALINVALSRKKEMISVLPMRSKGGLSHVLIQPLRYWWELALPRRLFNRPPTLSSCWLIRRKTLKKLGSFQAVSRSIIPETYFSRELTAQDAYSFIVADPNLQITTEKSVENQRSTALRVRYPQLHKRLELLALHIILLLLFVISPFVFMGFWVSGSFATVVPSITICLLFATQGLILFSTDRRSTLFGMILLPVSVIIEFTMAILSMWRYEFSQMEWKGRNVCIPAMHRFKAPTKF